MPPYPTPSGSLLVLGRCALILVLNGWTVNLVPRALFKAREKRHGDEVVGRSVLVQKYLFQVYSILFQGIFRYSVSKIFQFLAILVSQDKSGFIGGLWRPLSQQPTVQAFSSGALMFCSRIKKAHVETRKEGRKWWLQQYEHKQAAFARPKYACTAGYSHKYDIPLPPTLSQSMLAGPENMEGRSPCRENKKFLGVIRLLGNLRRKNSCNQGMFFQEKNRISFITKILTADELRSNVTITLRDKSRYFLIVKI